MTKRTPFADRFAQFSLPLEELPPEAVAGVDEAGRGCLAGPVVAGAVILPEDFDMPDLDDSKALTAEVRSDLYPEIRSRASAFCLGVSWQGEIDERNILQATFLAMSRAVTRLKSRPRLLLIDGNQTIPEPLLGQGYLQRAVVGGDASIQAIAAASVLAKVWRDQLMEVLDTRYPGYGLARHKGYATSDHLEAIKKLGPSPIHRLTFKGVRKEEPAPGGQGCLPGL